MIGNTIYKSFLVFLSLNAILDSQYDIIAIFFSNKMLLYNTMKTKDEKIPSFTAIILAGGKSSRMGSYKNKSMLRLNGQYLIDIVKSKLECVVGDNIIIVGPPMIISRAAPTDWAVELAQKIGISLVGFVRGRRMNIYTHPQQIEA